MRDVIYIHGFASSGNSFKGDLLREYFGKNAHTPNLKSKPKDDISYLKELILDLNNPILVGSSLGGFYAEYLSKTLHLDGMLINPLTDVTFAKNFIGEHSYFETDESFYFTKEDYQDLLNYSLELRSIEIGLEKRVVLVAKDEDVLDYTRPLEHFTCQFDSIKLFDYGGHSFNLKDEIITNIEYLL